MAHRSTSHRRDLRVSLLAMMLLLSTIPGALIGRSAAALSTGHVAPAPVSVQFYGDSLTFQAWPYLLSDFNLARTTVHVNASGGLALCDWMPAIMGLTTSNAPNVIVLQFFGNPFTACISPYAGSYQTLVAKYGADLKSAITHLRSVGTKHIIVDVGPPDSNPTQRLRLVAEFTKVLSGFGDPNYQYATSADLSVLSPTDAFAQFLPCLPIEMTTGDCSGPTINHVRDNVVRSADTVHFCPISAVWANREIGICPMYSSGGYRFARALAQLVWHDEATTALNLDTVPVVSSVIPTGGHVSAMVQYNVFGHDLLAVSQAEFVEVTALSPRGYKFTATSATVQRTISDSEIQILAPSSLPTSANETNEIFLMVRTPTAQSAFLGPEQGEPDAS